jgi:hypothetical protein
MQCPAESSVPPTRSYLSLLELDYPVQDRTVTEVTSPR